MPGLDAAALDRIEPAHRHHRVRRTRRPARRSKSIEADISGRNAERRRDRGIIRRRADIFRQSRKLEHRPPLLRRRCHAARHRADVEPEDEIARLRSAVEQPKQHRRPDRRMTGERQFRNRREDANACAMRPRSRRQHEHRLRQIELARDGLHRRSVETVRLQHDRERIAGKALVGEHVERDEAAAHDGTSNFLGFEDLARIDEFVLRLDQQDLARACLGGAAEHAEHRRCRAR